MSLHAELTDVCQSCWDGHSLVPNNGLPPDAEACSLCWGAASHAHHHHHVVSPSVRPSLRPDWHPPRPSIGGGTGHWEDDSHMPHSGGSQYRKGAVNVHNDARHHSTSSDNRQPSSDIKSPQHIAKNEADIAQLKEQLALTRAEFSRLKQQMQRPESHTSPADMDDLRLRFRETITQLQKTQADLDKAQGELKRAQEDVRQVDQQKQSWRNEKHKMERDFAIDMHEAQRKMNRLQEERDQFRTRCEQMDDALRQAQADFDDLSQQFNLLTSRAGSPIFFPAAPMAPVPGPGTSAFHQYGPPVKPTAVRPMSAPSANQLIQHQILAVPTTPSAPVSQAKPDNAQTPPKKSDLHTGPVRGRGACAPPMRPHDVPWAEANRSASPSSPLRGYDTPLSLCWQLGLGIRVLENAYDPEDGILEVYRVALGSRAERAGVRMGDRIEKWNLRAITTPEQFYSAVQKTAPGSRLRLGLMRLGERRQAIIDV